MTTGPTADEAILLARAVLLFYDPSPWDAEKGAHWRALTGEIDVTNKVLCDFARRIQAGLISIDQAASLGILRVRKPHWLSRFDHLRIDILGGRPGPWLYLHAPANAMFDGPDPKPLLALMQTFCPLDERGWLPYTGPLPTSAEYQAELKRFEAIPRPSLSPDEA